MKRPIQRAVIEGHATLTNPLSMVEVDGADLQAFRNLMAAQATPEDQRRFIEWFIKATGMKELEFRESDRLSAVASGKRWVGVQFFTAAQSAITER